MIDLLACQQQLEQNGGLIGQIVSGITQEQSKLKPSAEDWSVLEVINHLYDEEREDFRQRFDYLLHHPGKKWPSIDPAGWITARKYNERELASSLHNFLDERQKSLVWLAGLENPNLELYEMHPQAGKLYAGEMLAAWVAHDLLHLRQLLDLKYFLMQEIIRPYSPRYAGEW
ncbi:MAG: DinB family protein [Chloroflexi bacterium]|nr:DinB family protein [Chloroflexota bacterium]